MCSFQSLRLLSKAHDATTIAFIAKQCMYCNVWLADNFCTPTLWSIIKQDWLKGHVHLQTTLWRHDRCVCLKNVVRLPIFPILGRHDSSQFMLSIKKYSKMHLNPKLHTKFISRTACVFKVSMLPVSFEFYQIHFHLVWESCAHGAYLAIRLYKTGCILVDKLIHVIRFKREVMFFCTATNPLPHVSQKMALPFLCENSHPHNFFN